MHLTFKLNGLETIYAGSDFEIGTSSIRLFIAWYKGLPFEITEDIYLPKSAADILTNYVPLNQEQIDYLEGHVIGSSISSTPESDQNQTEVLHNPESSSDRMIKGKTTFREVLDWGISIETIEEILGGEITNPLEKIKDYCYSNGLAFETIKLSIQTEIDKLP